MVFTMPKADRQKKIGELVPFLLLLIVLFIEHTINTTLAANVPSAIVVPALSFTCLNYDFAPTTLLCV